MDRKCHLGCYCRWWTTSHHQYCRFMRVWCNPIYSCTSSIVVILLEGLGFYKSYYELTTMQLKTTQWDLHLQQPHRRTVLISRVQCICCSRASSLFLHRTALMECSNKLLSARHQQEHLSCLVKQCTAQNASTQSHSASKSNYCAYLCTRSSARLHVPHYSWSCVFVSFSKAEQLKPVGVVV